ncbi:MAG: STAS domain-containing protein [Calditrichaeota bacterium]|nr:STAS domain-containing protein [Calditrichota bacterium]
MTIETQEKDQVVILQLDGDVMGGPEALQLNEEINRLLDAGKTRVVLDLSRVERMNSSGLGILINAVNVFKQNGGRLKLANLNKRILHLLNVTRLMHIFEVYDTVDAAVESF